MSLKPGLVRADRASGEERPGATRRRGAELEDAILDAAWQVLTSQGYAGFTYEAVAAQAGTSRPVLYRRWPQREDLLLATLRKNWSAEVVTVPDTGRLRDDVVGLLRNANSVRGRLIALLSVQLVDYFRETGTSISELRDFLRGGPDQPTALERIVARAVARGELVDRPRSARIVNLAFDLMRNEMLMTMRPAADEAIREIVDEVWLPLVRP